MRSRRNAIAWLALAGLGVAGMAGFACRARLADDVAQVMEHAREALGRDPTAAAHGALVSGNGNFEGMALRMTLAWDGAGRFVLEGRGPVNMAKGHDGEVTWERRPSGQVRQMRLGDRYRELLTHWVLSGYWCQSASGLEASLNRQRSTAKLAAIDLRFAQTEFGGTMLLDRESWLPRSFTVRDIGRDFELRFGAFLSSAGVVSPGEVRILADQREIGTLQLESVVARPAFPPRYFAQREDAAQLAWHDDAAVELEVHRGRWGHLFVRPQINGVSAGWFAFDTGASTTVIDHGLAADLNLPRVGSADMVGVGGPSAGAVHTVRSIQVGGLELQATPVTAGPIRGLSLGHSLGQVGLLGMDVLAHAVIVYDLANSRIELHRPGTYDLPDAQWQPLLDYNGKPTVQLAYESHEGLFTIDTGNAGAIQFSPFATRRLALLEERDTQPGTVGGIGGRVNTRDGDLSWLDWGGRRLQQVPAQFLIEERGVGADPFRDGVVGTDLLERSVVVFDMSQGRIAFLPQRGT